MSNYDFEVGIIRLGRSNRYKIVHDRGKEGKSEKKE
jgi:hypothetical protein